MAAAYRHEELQKIPAGYRVRSVKRGSHIVRVAFPPGRRKKGSGKVVEILHPKAENNPSCIVSSQARKNPGELLIFGNPSSTAAKRATRERAARIRGARLNSVVWGNPKKKNQTRLIDAIRFGDRVTIVDRFGQQRTGRAVMRSSSGGWVLNMGGPHGTPGLADDRNVVRVKRSKNPVRMQVFHDPAIKKFTAVLYDPKFGNLYASGYTKKQAAQALRDRVREYRRSGKLPAGGGYGNPRRSTKRRRRTDRNPDETKQAVKLFQSFHGKDPKDIVEKHVSAAIRKDYAALGELIAIGLDVPNQHGQSLVNNWQKENHFGFEGDGVMLASSPNGKQMYLVGGNQNLSQCLKRVEHDDEKDFIDLGDIGFVVYLARKVHGNFEPIEYVHELGEKTGVLPRGMYDKLKRQIFFVGGEYFIDTKKGVSPGIEN